MRSVGVTFLNTQKTEEDQITPLNCAIFVEQVWPNPLSAILPSYLILSLGHVMIYICGYTLCTRWTTRPWQASLKRNPGLQNVLMRIHWRPETLLSSLQPVWKVQHSKQNILYMHKGHSLDYNLFSHLFKYLFVGEHKNNLFSSPLQV